jgi:hypothetical protein
LVIFFDSVIDSSCLEEVTSFIVPCHSNIVFVLAGFLTVSARNDAELDRSCQEVTDAAQQAYLDLQPMWGQQDVGFVCGALPLCHGLARAGLLDR